MLWPILFVSLFFFSILINRWRNRKLIKLSKQLKNDAWCLPLIGHAYKFIGNGEALLKGLQYFGRQGIQYGGNTSFWLGNTLCVSISDAADAEFVTKNYLEKGYVMNFIRDIIGNGNITAPVPIWRPRRKIMSPTFCPKNIMQFMNVNIKNSAIMAKLLESKVGTGPFSIWEYLTSYTMDSVCESTLGVDLKIHANRDHPFFENYTRGIKILATRLLNPWQHSDVIYKFFPSYHTLKRSKEFLNCFINEIIVAKRKELLSNVDVKNVNKNKVKGVHKDGAAAAGEAKATLAEAKQTSKTFLELLIEASGGENGYTDVELREEISVLVIAGTDTSAVGTGFTLLMLSRHPEVQKKVYEELKEVFEDTNRPVSPEDVPRLNYLEIVIKETLRLYPPVPFIVRHADRDLTLPSGVTVVENAMLFLNLWALQRNPRYWGPDAEKFRPERWLDNFKHPAQYMGFSYGPRNCVGNKYAMFSMTIAIVTILRRYRILADTSLATGETKPLRVSFEVTMKDVDNFTVKLEKRN